MNNNELTREIEGTIQSAKKVVLSAQEKSAIKNRISNYVKSNPIVARELSNNTVSNKYNFNAILGMFSYRHMYVMPVLLLLVLTFGAGTTSYVAQSALPGDVLYGVKTGFNENVESLFAISPEAKAQVDLRQVSARLEEAEKLSVAGNLSEVQSQAIQVNLSKKVESLNKNISKVKKSGDVKKVAEKVSSDFDKEIDDHYDTFVTISNSASNSPTFASILSSKKSRIGENVSVMMMTTAKIAAPKPENTKKEVKKEDDSKSKSGNDDDDDDDDEDGDDDHGTKIVLPAPVPVPASTTPPVQATSSPSTTPVVVSYTLLQVALHKTSMDCWSVVSGGVYNLTSWIAQHPGGQSAIKGMCGVDATASFMAQHGGQGNPAQELASFKIGIVK